MQDADESRRALTLPQPGDPHYVLGPWDLEDLQAAVDRLAAQEQNGKLADDQRREDLVLQLELRGRDVRLPKHGLAFRCEACGEASRVRGQSGPRVAGVPWAWFPDAERVEAAMRYVSTDVGDRLCVWPHRSGCAGYRLLVVCAACARSHQGKRGLQRCWHEEKRATDDWWRCERVVVGRDYCPAHCTRQARYRRDRGQARRASANVPPLVADITPEELGGASLELLSIVRELRGSSEDHERLKDSQRSILRIAKRIADT